ncbi:conserved membrane protein of unknown function [Tenacibaculum sp. 190524A02b]|uniref:hypothetical protein n=1 Tax=Tenacibaculum vairaonense TaxID=3137860 RepID=UPI0032B2FBEF
MALELGKQLSAKNIFLVDAVGALLSAFLLGVLLPKYQYLFGIPINTLYILACIPLLFIVYDIACYFLINKNPTIFIKVIALFNILYSIVSLTFAFIHYHQITVLGWIYMITEIVIILTLVTIEIRLANRSII